MRKLKIPIKNVKTRRVSTCQGQVDFYSVFLKPLFCVDNVLLGASVLKHPFAVDALPNGVHHTEKMLGRELCREDVAASFTKAAVDSVVKNIDRAHSEYDFKTLVVSGGVAANSHLREALSVWSAKNGVRLCIPSRKFCGDNAAMIASQGYYEYLAGNVADESLNASPTSRSSREV